jgi:VWFA-related protein
VTALDSLSDAAPRSAIVLLSDGEDVGSRVSAAEATRALAKSRVTIYPVTHGAAVDQWQGGSHTAHLTRQFAGPAYLSQLASASGGRVFTPDDGDLDRVLGRIVRELSSQYVLGFAPAPTARAGDHKLKIRVQRKDAKIRHRPGYVLEDGKTASANQ